jgi:hypothetical protein
MPSDIQKALIYGFFGLERVKGIEPSLPLNSISDTKRLFRLRNGFDGIGGDDLIPLVKPLLRCSWLLRSGCRKNEARRDSYLDDFLFEKLRQVIGRARFGDEFRHLRQLHKVLVGKSRRTDKRY